jgi:hypothetical protein
VETEIKEVSKVKKMIKQTLEGCNPADELIELGRFR